jgi:glycosyltransferase involved in cell wall biosynthesis
MKVLHIINGLNDGGAEASLFRLVKEDKRVLHTVVSLSSGGKYLKPLITANINVLVISFGYRENNLYNFFKLLKIIVNLKPNLIQSWMYHSDFISGIIGFLIKIPVVWGVRNNKLSIKDSKITTILVARLCSILSYHIPSVIVCCAESAIFQHISIGYDRKKFKLISNGYDETLFPFVEINSYLKSKKFSFLNESFVIGMIARYHPIKDHENFIKSLHILNNKGIKFKAVLVGYGIDNENKVLNLMIQDYNLTNCVFLLGQISDVTLLIPLFDIHVLSSTSEAFPNVICEAMLCGIPCVATDVGETKNIINKTGWVVPCRDSLLLANAIEQANLAWLDKLSWAHRRKQCRASIVSRFSINSIRDQYFETWSRIALNNNNS